MLWTTQKYRAKKLRSVCKAVHVGTQFICWSLASYWARTRERTSHSSWRGKYRTVDRWAVFQQHGRANGWSDFSVSLHCNVRCKTRELNAGSCNYQHHQERLSVAQPIGISGATDSQLFRLMVVTKPLSTSFNNHWRMLVESFLSVLYECFYQDVLLHYLSFAMPQSPLQAPTKMWTCETSCTH